MIADAQAELREAMESQDADALKAAITKASGAVAKARVRSQQALQWGNNYVGGWGPLGQWKKAGRGR